LVSAPVPNTAPDNKALLFAIENIAPVPLSSNSGVIVCAVVELLFVTGMDGVVCSTVVLVDVSEVVTVPVDVSVGVTVSGLV